MTPTAAPGRLALSQQDLFTVIARLRGDRAPVRDAESFRTQARTLLAKAEQAGAAAGYAATDVRVSLFAAVAFLDESVLNSPQPALAEWSRRPLQDELFGGHMGGELFYQYLEQQLARADEPALADVLEVFHHALLLGFRGRYGSDAGALKVIAQRVGDRITRIRGGAGDLAPAWRPVDDAVAARDPWIRRLAVGAVLSALLVVALWATGRATLASGRSEIRTITDAASR
jgi:type VI secretion system protein ImpK